MPHTKKQSVLSANTALWQTKLISFQPVNEKDCRKSGHILVHLVFHASWSASLLLARIQVGKQPALPVTMFS